MPPFGAESEFFMSATSDAAILAIQRACAKSGIVDPDAIMDFAERFYDGRASDAERKAVADEFAKVTRADIGRPPLTDIREQVLDKTAERILESWQSYENPEPIV
jgi:hypothetical protein